MCGRYALSLRVGRVRSRLADQRMPVAEAPDDDDVRSTYNFAPGSNGLIYRAQGADYGAEPEDEHGDERDEDDGDEEEEDDGEPATKKAKTHHTSPQQSADGKSSSETTYKLQAAKWGLIPFWTKRPPDYGSQLRTINCRDDSLMENRGMWNTMKQRKRCVVVCEGFYEWLKKNNGKEKIPHYVKRKDGELLCFAGLWDMVQYEGSDEKLYSYTIITTDSNKQLRFLHDRMPVVLEPGSEAMRKWLDPKNVGWSKELQSMLKPYEGELDCYPVDKGVGKVGNNSPLFVVPVDSKENKNNIANFFGTQRATAKDVAAKHDAARKEQEVKQEGAGVTHEDDEQRGTTVEVESTEDNAPLPMPEGSSEEALSQRIKQDTDKLDDTDIVEAATAEVDRGIKREIAEVDNAELIKAAEEPPKKKPSLSSTKSSPEKKPQSGRKTRSATSNSTVAKTPTKEGNARITSFFGK